MSQEDWENLEAILGFLEPFEDASELLAGKTYITSSLVVPTFNGLMDHVETFKSHKSIMLKEAASAAYDKLNKYYSKTSEMLTVATLCDPRFNLQWYKDDEDGVSAESIRAVFENAFENYKPVSNVASAEPKPSSPVKKFKLAIFKSQGQVKDEITAYLGRQREPETVDPLQWWKSHEKEYPTVAKMARDHLAIAASSIEDERVFSASEYQLAKKRCSMLPSTLRRLVCVRYWHQKKAAKALHTAI